MNAAKFILLVIGLLIVLEITTWTLLDRLAIVAICLVVICYLWSRLSLRRLTIDRELTPERAQVGQMVKEHIRLSNGSRLGKLWLEVQDFSTLPGHRASQVVHVGGRRSASWNAETLCVHRGKYRLGLAVVHAGDPFGLFPTRTSLGQETDVIVYPPTLDLSAYLLSAGELTGGARLNRPTAFVTPNVSGVREYAPGDAFSRISWMATARTGHIMVKEFDHDPMADLWIVVDLEERFSVHVGRTAPFQADRADRWPIEAWLDATEEYAIAIAASLSETALRRRRNVGLISTGNQRELLPPDHSARQLMKILDVLAVTKADGHQPLAEVLTAEEGRFSRQTSLVVITSATDDAWVAPLLRIQLRGVQTRVIFIEPETFGKAEPSLLVMSSLLAAGVPTHLVKYGEEIVSALGAPASGGRAPRGAFRYG